MEERRYACEHEARKQVFKHHNPPRLLAHGIRPAGGLDVPKQGGPGRVVAADALRTCRGVGAAAHAAEEGGGVG